MTEARRQTTQRILQQGVEQEDAEAELEQRWAEFSQARASLAEVMSDDELRDFGMNVDVLDERP